MELTEVAAKKLRPLISEDEGVRLGVKGGGCAGFEYKFGVVPIEDIFEDDHIVENLGVKVFIDAISYTYLQNVIIDWKEDTFSSRFTINNPDISGSCGCGNSFY